ncbi:MAG: endoglucanase [Spirochaetia bacterium]|nr:endoglucanase [Spirochaetia bacterium]
MKRKIMMAIVLLAGLITACASGTIKNFASDAATTTAYTWKSVVTGGGGFIPGVVFHPAEKGLCYLRTDMGGAYRYDPEGEKWVCITDMFGKDESEYNGILSIGLDPNDTGRVYLMTGKYTQDWAGKGAFRISTDRGDNWKTVKLPFKVGGNEDGRGAGERVAVDPNLGSIIFMGSTGDGLWRSVDHGSSWERVAGFTPVNVNFVVFDGTSGTKGSATKRLFAAADDGAGSLYVSNDAGSTWTLVAGRPQGLIALRNSITPQDLYLTYSDATGPNGAKHGSVWKYNIAAGTWTDLKVPAGMGGFSGISINPKDPKTIIVSTLNRWDPLDEIYLTHDGGKTWAPRIAKAAWDSSYAPYSKRSEFIKPHWISCVVLDPYDPDRAIFTTGYGLWESRNINAKKPLWAFRNNGIEEPVPMQIISPPKGARLFTALGDIDGFRYEDNLDVSPDSRYNPIRWTTLSIAAAYANPDIMVKAFNRSPYGAYSKDNGKSWIDFGDYPGDATAGGSRAIAISADGKIVVWAAEKSVNWQVQDSSLRRSENLGEEWTVCGGIPEGKYHPVADTVNPAKFYVFSGEEGTMYVSADFGVSFTKTFTGLPLQVDAGWQAANAVPAPGIEGDVWFSSGRGGFYRTTDSGKSFSMIKSVDEAYRFGFGKAADGKTYPAIYLWGTIHGVTGLFRSDDEAKTWTRINDDRHQYGWIHNVTGDMREYGRCYISAEGRGSLYGDAVVK